MFNYLLRRRLLRLSLFFPLVLLTTGCSRGDDSNINTGNKTDSGNENQLAAEQTVVTKTLMVDSQRCTGCGKCSRFDPEHFSFNPAIGKAVVISQDNLESNDLHFAISACQDRAIALK